MKRFLLVVVFMFSCLGAYSQSIYGSVLDSNGQYIQGQMVTVTTDTVNGVPYPYYNTAITGTNGFYLIQLGTQIPNGVIFVISTTSCMNTMTNTFLFQGNSINCSFAICATNNYIRGRVTLGDTITPADEAMVYLIQQEVDSNTSSYILTALDSMEVDSGSAFYNMPIPMSVNGTLLVKAALLPSSSNYINYLPSYYTSALQWNSATAMSNANITANIVLPQGMNTQGQGFISGSVLQGANNSTGVGDPLYKRILILTTDNNVPVAYRYSDIDGAFSFGGLAYGTYKLFGDALGKANPPLIFSLSANNPSFTDITFEEDSTSFMGFLWPLSVNTLTSPVIKVYPNPVRDYLQVSGLAAIEGEKNIQLTDINGAIIYSEKVNGEDHASIGVKDLVPGMYLLHLSSPAGRQIYRIAK